MSRKPTQPVLPCKADGSPLPPPWTVGQQVHARIGARGALAAAVVVAIDPLALRTVAPPPS